MALVAGASSAAHPSAPVCGPASAKTLAASHAARVYGSGHWVYGCAAGAGRTYRLGQRPTCIGPARIAPVMVTGTLAGYGSERCGVDTGSAEIVVRRLTDGKTLARLPATTTSVGAESYQSVTALVLNGAGAVAWIAVNRSIIGSGMAIEVRKHDATGSALLDSGAGIQTASLQRHGSQLTWRHGGQLRHARLS
jgi:hypothetical protein